MMKTWQKSMSLKLKGLDDSAIARVVEKIKGSSVEFVGALRDASP